MPLTPFHALAFMFLHFKNKKLIDPLALAISTTFLDLEPLCYWLLGEPLTHRILHGFTLALTIYPIIVAFGTYLTERAFENQLWQIYRQLRINPVKVRYPLLNIYSISLFGGLTHILFDMFTHREMFWVLYPFIQGNPFYLGRAAITVEVTIVLLSVYSLTCWLQQTKFDRIKIRLFSREAPNSAVSSKSYIDYAQ